MFPAYNGYIERSETKMKKAIITLLLAALVLAAIPALATAQNTFTAADGTATGNAPTVQNTTYEGFGYVEVDFLQDVNYENPTVTVTDANGAAIAAGIVQLDDDALTVHIIDYAAVATSN